MMNYWDLEHTINSHIFDVESVQRMLELIVSLDTDEVNQELYEQRTKELRQKQAALAAVVVEHKDELLKALKLARAAELLGFEKQD